MLFLIVLGLIVLICAPVFVWQWRAGIFDYEGDEMAERFAAALEYRARAIKVGALVVVAMLRVLRERLERAVLRARWRFAKWAAPYDAFMLNIEIHGYIGIVPGIRRTGIENCRFIGADDEAAAVFVKPHRPVLD